MRLIIYFCQKYCLIRYFKWKLKNQDNITSIYNEIYDVFGDKFTLLIGFQQVLFDRKKEIYFSERKPVKIIKRNKILNEKKSILTCKDVFEDFKLLKKKTIYIKISNKKHN